MKSLILCSLLLSTAGISCDDKFEIGDKLACDPSPAEDITSPLSGTHLDKEQSFATSLDKRRYLTTSLNIQYLVTSSDEEQYLTPSSGESDQFPLSDNDSSDEDPVGWNTEPEDPRLHDRERFDCLRKYLRSKPVKRLSIQQGFHSCLKDISDATILTVDRGLGPDTLDFMYLSSLKELFYYMPLSEPAFPSLNNPMIYVDLIKSVVMHSPENQHNQCLGEVQKALDFLDSTFCKIAVKCAQKQATRSTPLLARTAISSTSATTSRNKHSLTGKSRSILDTEGTEEDFSNKLLGELIGARDNFYKNAAAQTLFFCTLQRIANDCALHEKLPSIKILKHLPRDTGMYSKFIRSIIEAYPPEERNDPYVKDICKTLDVIDQIFQIRAKREGLGLVKINGEWKNAGPKQWRDFPITPDD
ncbi:MAG: hypothetical protein LBQ43_03085 [Holosporales bacterium]|jgi:hypothetical protein|nr:hypothetical protein [Holosporales bacterium]